MSVVLSTEGVLLALATGVKTGATQDLNRLAVRQAQLRSELLDVQKRIEESAATIDYYDSIINSINKKCRSTSQG